MAIKIENSSFVWIHRLLDFTLPTLFIFLAHKLIGYDFHSISFQSSFFTGGMFIVIAQISGVYTNWRGRRISESLGHLTISLLISWAVTIVGLFLLNLTIDVSRSVMIVWLILSFSGLVGYRIIIRLIMAKYREKTNRSKKVAIFGAGVLGESTAKAFNSNKWMGFEITQFYDDNKEIHGSQLAGKPILGSEKDLMLAVQNERVDEVYICLPMRAEKRIKDLLNMLADSTITVKLIPDLFTFDLLHSQISNVKGIPIISVYDTPFNSIASKILKRTEDIVLSTLILLLISPILVLLAIGVKISSPGPVFYKQSRVGWNGKIFSMLKFRSMPVDVEKDGVKWGSAKSKTTTKFGQLIRATSLDELPQFINVLLGDMSIVGPRPERDVFVEQFRKEIPRYMQKHMAKAGITGWAQINGWRGDTSLVKRVEFDLYYINHWSLWFDIKIIFLTVFKGFVNKNAY